MENIEQKIKKFEESCYKMASSEANEIIDKIDVKIKENIMQDLQEYEQEKQREYQKKITKLEHSYNSKIFELNSQAKHTLLQKKLELSQKMNSKLKQELEKFTNSEKYEKYLIQNINQATKKMNINEKDKISIYITKKDLDRFKEKINETFTCNLGQIEASYIGGSICTNNSKTIIINNTLSQLLEP